MKYVRLLIGFAVGALFVWLLVRRLDVDDLSRALRHIEYRLLIPTLALVLVGFVARAYRWGYLFPGSERVPFRRLYTATMIGYMGNALLPARAGEFIRAYVISRTDRTLPVSKAFATIVSERIFDGAALIVLMIVTLIVLPTDRPVVFPGGTFSERSITITESRLVAMGGAALGVIAVAVGMVALVYLRGDAMARIVGKTVSRLSHRAGQRAVDLITSFASGFAIVRDKRRLAAAGVLTVVVWTPAALAIYPMLYAFPEEVRWPWYTSIVVTAVVSVGIMIPASPGFVGTFHAFCVAGLLLCAPVDFDSAVAISVVYHGATMVGLVATGIVCLWIENLSFMEVARRAERRTV